MSATLIASISGLVTGLCWGLADWIVGKTSKHTDVFELNFTVQFVGAVVLGIVLLFSGVRLPSHSQMLTIFAAAVMISAGYLLFVQALSSGSVGIVVPLSSIYPLLTLALSVLFLGSIFAGLQIVAMVAVVLGSVLLAYEKNHDKIPFREFHRETFLALLAALIWGVAFFILNPLLGKLPWQDIAGLCNISMAFVATLILVVTRKSKTPEAIRRSLSKKITLLASLIYSVATIALYFGSGHSKSIIIPLVLGGCAPLISSILAAIFDKEKIGIPRRIGAVIAVAGIILLNAA